MIVHHAVIPEKVMQEKKMSQAWLGERESQKFVFLPIVGLWSKTLKSDISFFVKKQTTNKLAVLKREHYIFQREYLQWTELR